MLIRNARAADPVQQRRRQDHKPGDIAEHGAGHRYDGGGFWTTRISRPHSTFRLLARSTGTCMGRDFESCCRHLRAFSLYHSVEVEREARMREASVG